MTLKIQYGNGVPILFKVSL